MSSSKSGNKCTEPPAKRMKLANKYQNEEELKIKERELYKTVCKEVSYRNYFDYSTRFLLIYLPSCIKGTCRHYDKDKGRIQCMPPKTEELFLIEMRADAWYEALEVCRVSLNSTQYLSADVLKSIVYFMLNVHKDDYSGYPVEHIIDNCQQLLMQNFSTHPPCLDKDLRNTYKSFLISPMQNYGFIKEKENKNKIRYECDVGIVKYCFTRLEYEITLERNNEPLIDKNENIPEELRGSVRGFFCVKKNEHFKSLYRQERIERLFAVLETIVELLQFDLAIAQMRYTKVEGRHTRIEKLMECVLQGNNNTEAFPENCQQIIRIFIWVIELQYPDHMVKTIVIWLNTTIQTFYSRETNGNCDYPNTSKYCILFAKEFYKILSGKPQDSVIRILGRIEPKFMRHLIGLIHVHNVLSTNEACIIRILITFFIESQWESYPSDNSTIVLSKQIFDKTRKVNENVTSLIEKCILTPRIEDTADNDLYLSMIPDTQKSKTEFSLNHVVHLLYVTLEAYLDAYDIQSVYEKLTNSNNTPFDIETSSEQNNYSTTKYLMKKYVHILQSIMEFVNLFRDLKRQNKLPEVMNIFENIGFFKLYKVSSRSRSRH